MSPIFNRLVALSLAVTLPLIAGSARANCFDPFKRQTSNTSFEFITSKAGQVAPGEVRIEPTAFRDSFTFEATVSSSTAREVSGNKESHRSEILETQLGSAVTNSGDWACYTWTMKLAPDLALPAPGSPRAKLTVAQFHQSSAISDKEPAVLFIDLDPDGNLVALFNDPVGKRRTVLVPGGASGKDVLGKTWEIAMSAQWSTGSGGRVIIAMREKDKGTFVEVMNDTGQNATAGRVYQKLGLYRHNIERDPAFARKTISVFYSDITRNGVKATFRGLAGGMSPITAKANTQPSTVGALGSAASSATRTSPANGSASAYSATATRTGATPPARFVPVTMGRGASGTGGRGMTVGDY